ncbi:hypothetical protein FHS70_004587 [Flammeovirga yaeyamensis]|nr:hypothetical protein [Flammeovirga yaeyamensis]
MMTNMYSKINTSSSLVTETLTINKYFNGDAI